MNHMTKTVQAKEGPWYALCIASLSVWFESDTDEHKT